MYTGADITAAFLMAIIGLAAAESGQDLPAFLKICHRNDPSLNECIKHSVESSKQYLKTGIPALQIPSCEPIRLSRIEINQTAGAITIKSTYTDIEIHGGTNFTLKSVKIDVDNDRVTLKLFVPRLEMTARYNMEGKILLLPITGNGMARGNWTDIDVVATIHGERYRSEKTGETHYRVTDFYVDLNVGHADIHLDNLFNGDRLMSEAMNLFLNNNWETVAAEIKPVLEQTISEFFKMISNKIYSRFSINTLLPL